MFSKQCFKEKLVVNYCSSSSFFCAILSFVTVFLLLYFSFLFPLLDHHPIPPLTASTTPLLVVQVGRGGSSGWRWGGSGGQVVRRGGSGGGGKIVVQGGGIGSGGQIGGWFSCRGFKGGKRWDRWL